MVIGVPLKQLTYFPWHISGTGTISATVIGSPSRQLLSPTDPSTLPRMGYYLVLPRIFFSLLIKCQLIQMYELLHLKVFTANKHVG